MLEDGQIEEKEACVFTSFIHKKIQRLLLVGYNVGQAEQQNPKELIFECGILKDVFSQAELERIVRCSKEKIFNRGDVLIVKDKIITEAFFIATGVVSEKNGGIDDHRCAKVRHKMGDIIGLQHLLHEGSAIASKRWVWLTAQMRMRRPL